MKLSIMSFNLLIPVINSVDDYNDPNNMNIPWKGILFFELKQKAFQAPGKDGRVKDIHLVPSIVVVEFFQRSKSLLLHAEFPKGGGSFSSHQPTNVVVNVVISSK